MGVIRTVTKAGSGSKPTKGSTITVHCTGFVKSADGKDNKKFWSTKDDGQTLFTFQVGMGNVIKAWDQGCMEMQLGECASLECTSDFGYGDTGFPAWGIPGKATLIFDIEIVKIA